MAGYVQTKVRVEVNGVDLTDHVRDVSLTMDKEVVDATAMGDTFRKSLDSFHTWTLSVKFMHDFAAAKVHATLNPLYQNDTVFTVKIRPTTDAISATNPEFQGSARLKSYPMVMGGIGALAEIDVNFEPHAAPTIAVA